MPDLRIKITDFLKAHGPARARSSTRSAASKARSTACSRRCSRRKNSPPPAPPRAAPTRCPGRSSTPPRLPGARRRNRPAARPRRRSAPPTAARTAHRRAHRAPKAAPAPFLASITADHRLVINHGAAGPQVFSPEHAAYEFRLPTVVELFPELASAGPEDDTPSCSLAQALERQHLFVNQAVVTPALQLLWQIFRVGRLTWHGAFVDLESGRTTPLPVDPKAWKRFGYEPRQTGARK